MSRLLILFRPREAVITTANTAAEKFNLMHGVSLQVLACKTISEVGFHLSQRKVAIVFIESQLETVDVNTLVGHYLGQKERPYLITDEGSFEALKRYVPPEKLGRTSTLFSEGFIFDCLRNLLAPTGKKNDIRYIEEIVKNLVEVVHENTGFHLVPKRISEKNETSREISMVSVVGFYGDGFLGSLTVTPSPKLMRSIAEKMLFISESEVTNEALVDLMAEVSNQIEGAVRNGLQLFGYRLTSSMQVALVGDKLIHSENTGGLNYDILFHLGGETLNANLSYNTYRTSIAEIGEVAKRTTRRSMDVRLLNVAINATKTEIESQLKVRVKKGLIRKQSTSIEKCASFQIFHASDWQNKITLVLIYPNGMPTALGGSPGEESLSPDDALNRLMVAITASFMISARDKGYSLQKVYQGQFSGSEFDFNLLSMGLFVRQELRSDELNVDVLFGMDSSAVESLYDVWPCFKDAKFMPQALNAKL